MTGQHSRFTALPHDAAYDNTYDSHYDDPHETSSAAGLLNPRHGISGANHAAPDSSLSRYELPESAVSAPTPLVHFRTTTIAPSPPPPFHDEVLPASPAAGLHRTSASALRVATDLGIPLATTPRSDRLSGNNSCPSMSLDHKSSSSSLHVTRTPSLKAALANSLGTASATSSAYPSPIISAMGDVTPLPSPLLSGDSPGPWKMLSTASTSPPQARDRLRAMGEESVLVTSSGESIDSALTHATKRRLYASLEAGDTPPAQAPVVQQPQHARNRSVSEYVPDASVVPKRQVTVSGTHTSIDSPDAQLEPQMRRELNLAQSRGLTAAITQPPTPPPSESSKDSVDGATKPKPSHHEYFEARGRHDNKRRRWRSIRLLGQGTFSRVMLATTQIASEEDALDGRRSPTADSHLDRRTLVAIKVCEHGPRGGASEERVEMSLKRELEIMQTIHHPSLVDLRAWSIEPTRAILVLSYCIGGDLFDVATAHREALSPVLLRRMFAELVSAVSYLHERRIVHRDIKLENVLVNLTPAELSDPSIDWTTYPYSITTLTDLGLSRRIADDEKLETRCGSDDYAAPEVIMGQPYDGRATDAWSLGVLLYALLEARLPFDPHPGMSDAHRMRSRTSHRIARVEWRWVEYAGDDGDHDGDEAKFRDNGLLGAMQIAEGLLKRARSRWSVAKVAAQPWVREAIALDGGLHFREEEDGEEVM